MENQHRKISGYRELSQEEIDLMNEIKAFGPQLESLLGKISGHVDQQYYAVSTLGDADAQAEADRLETADPNRWIDIGNDHLKQGLMALTRAIAQPGFF